MKYTFEYAYHGHVTVTVDADNVEQAGVDADIKLDYMPAETILRNAVWTTRQVTPFTTKPVNYPYNPD